MWYGFDADLQRQLATLKELTVRRYQVPTNEWPVVFVKEHDALLIVREWPNGQLTAYTVLNVSDRARQHDDTQPR